MPDDPEGLAVPVDYPGLAPPRVWDAGPAAIEGEGSVAELVHVVHVLGVVAHLGEDAVRLLRHAYAIELDHRLGSGRCASVCRICSRTRVRIRN